jgi:peptidoglycan/LPS O-acetylase OafA/YrhL
MAASVDAGRVPDNRLPSLTGLRFVAALAVFGFHVNVQALFADSWAASAVGRIFGQGAIGVSFFFILSGFVLTWSARPGTTARRIWRRRAAKIFPNHLVTWIVGLAALAYTSHAVSFAATLPGFLLLQAWIPVPNVFFAVNTPAWSLSCEVAFYAAFPFLLRAIGRVREDRLWRLAGVLTAAVFVVPVLALTMPGGIAYWFVYVFPVTRALEFMIGMTLARIVRADRWIGVGLWPALGLLAVAYAVSGYLPGGFAYVAGTVIPLALVIPAAAVADLTGAPSPFRGRLFQWLGEVSFAFYLVHQIVMRFLDKALGDHTWSTLPATAIALLMLAFSLVGAWLLYRIVERPMMTLLTTPRRAGTPLLTAVR